MNLYEVKVNQFSVKVQASSAQVALKKGMVQLDHLNYMQFLGMKSLQGGETSTLNVAIHNVGKMIEIQRGNNIWADRKYVLATEWNKHIYSHDDWVTCKYAKEKELDDQLNHRRYAETIRNILKALHQMGDDAFWDGCWKTTDAEILDEWRPRLKQVNQTTMETIKDYLLIPGFKV